MKGISFLLDLLYPPRCAFCHDFLETSREGVCAHCRTGLPFAQNGGRQHFPFIPACVSPLNYEGNVRESLLRYKFGGATGYAKVYGRLVAETVRTELPGAYDIITWVPLSRKRLRERFAALLFDHLLPEAVERDERIVLQREIDVLFPHGLRRLLPGDRAEPRA